MTHKFIHDRENCISCGACAAINGIKWKMNKEDGKADLIIENITNDEFELDMETAESCPVNVIHINDENKKNLI